LKRIYLDNHASTQVDPNVLDKMLPWFTEQFGNEASNTHSFGWEAREAVDIAREQIANEIKAKPSEIIFTSGATESINIALQGIIKNTSIEIPHIITFKTEHTAVLDTCKILEKNGVEVSYLNIQSNGIIHLDEIKNAIKSNTLLISILHGNNEIGVIQPIEEIGKICRENNIFFHVDGAQTLGKVLLDMDKLSIDLFSMSSHKIYGPKGIGALYIRRKNPRVSLSPIISGGGQEKGLRPGTLPVPLIVGFGEAVQLAYNNLELENQRITKLRNNLIKGLSFNIEEIKINGDMDNRLPGNLNISFLNIKGESLIMRLGKISVSTGSACTSSTLKPSHVLKALGLSDELAFSTIRIGIGRFNTDEDIETAINLITDVIKNLKLKRKLHEIIN
jgi:cysteine desulfurase